MLPPVLSGEATHSDPRQRDDDLQDQSMCGVCQEVLTDPVSIPCGHSFCRQCIVSHWGKTPPSGGFACPQCRKRSRTHPVLHPQKAMKESMQEVSCILVDDVLNRVLQTHKTIMKKKYECLHEGINTEENQTPLNRVYTRLYILEGESEGVNEEHEVVQIKKTLTKQRSKDISINVSDIFKPVQGPERKMGEQNLRAVMAEGFRPKGGNEDKGGGVPKPRTLLTKGIAGIGKTVSVHKFILDWAEQKANQDVDFMFVLPFRELNLIKVHRCSLHKLLCDFYPHIKDLNLKIYDTHKFLFIFDGLDESRIPFNFSECAKVSDITVTSSVGELMTNLIKGELLPSALIWITSRPAAASQIPPQYINRMTEISGFTDPQKEEYFRKRISDQDQAEKIISHIKRARSLHIMCHIPVFCWISATVLQQFMKQTDAEIPKTLTEMYIHFLCIQTNMKYEKYEKKYEKKDSKKLLDSNRAMILKLAELAFKQLMKGNIMFYEEDLRECGIDVTEASVYSGICTQIFREECVLYQRKVYCFVHLTFQEFLAAFYVFHCYMRKNMEVVEYFTAQHLSMDSHENVPLYELLKGSVDKALKSQNGHLDLFLRFLLGISLESNQCLLQGLLTPTVDSSESISKTVKYIKDQIQTRHLPIERSINLFLCLAEMKDQSLYRGIQEYLHSEKHSGKKLSPGLCSALACMFLTSEVLDELVLKTYNTSEEGYRKLIPAISNCRKALLAGCNLTTDCIEIVCSTLTSTNAVMELDISNNRLLDPELNMLSAALKSFQCKLKILRLAGCNITRKCSETLCSALTSGNCSLRELDLSNNDLQDSPVEFLSSRLNKSHFKLETLRLAMCSLGEKSCANLGSALQVADLRELDLSNNDLHDSGVKQLSDGLKSLNSKLEILRLSGCMITEEGCSSLASALGSNPSNLKELDLTYNHPGDLGVKLLSARLEDKQCRLHTLMLKNAEEMRIKPGLHKYACELTLNPNTAHTCLSVLEGNRKVTCVRKLHSYPDNPNRFDVWEQVLCRESLSGRRYWECEWSGPGATVAVTYKGIARKGCTEDSAFGYNDKSWSLDCSDRFSACHNKNNTVLPVPLSNRVGVYLDSPAGTLSFYSISSDTHTLTHLHTFQSTFTEPLYAGFRISIDSSVYVYERQRILLCPGGTSV